MNPDMPLELYEYVWSHPEEVTKYRHRLSILLGTEITDFDSFKRASIAVTQQSNNRGVVYRDRDYRDILMYYKELASSLYVKRPIISAMRGSVVRKYENGEVKQVAFPFAKFFNRGEIPSTQKLPDKEKYVVTEKLDGTLLIVWRDPDTGEMRFNTRGLMDKHSVTRGVKKYYVSVVDEGIGNPYVIRFVNSIKRENLWYELESIVTDDRTVMFELTYKIPSSYQFDVLKTPEDSPDWKPYLLAYRSHKTLELVYPDNTPFRTPVRYKVSSLDDVMELVTKNDKEEGVVVYYPSMYYHPELKWWNYMVKLKNRTYVLRAYFHTGLASWKHLGLLVLAGKTDDLIPILNDEQRQFIIDYQNTYQDLLGKWIKFVDTIDVLVRTHGDKVYRVIANNLNMSYIIKFVKRAVNTGDYDEPLKQIIRSMLVNKNSKDAMISALTRFGNRLDKVRGYLSSQLGETQSEEVVLS